MCSLHSDISNRNSCAMWFAAVSQGSRGLVGPRGPAGPPGQPVSGIDTWLIACLAVLFLPSSETMHIFHLLLHLCLVQGIRGIDGVSGSKGNLVGGSFSFPPLSHLSYIPIVLKYRFEIWFLHHRQQNSHLVILLGLV